MRIALACLLLTGCTTARAALGAHETTAGRAGFDASGGVGMGWSWTGHQGVFVSADGGVTFADHARAVLYDRFEYVNHASIPFGIALRGGAWMLRQKYRELGQVFAGLGFSIYPFHTTPGPHQDHSDDSWATAPIGPDIDGWSELGVEVDADAVQGVGGVFTVNLVVATDTMLAK